MDDLRWLSEKKDQVDSILEKYDLSEQSADVAPVVEDAVADEVAEVLEPALLFAQPAIASTNANIATIIAIDRFMNTPCPFGILYPDYATPIKR